MLLITLAGAAILFPSGTAVSAGPAGDATVQTGDFTLSFNNDGGTTSFCPPGRTATGGGFGTVNPPPLNIAINVSAPVNKTELPGNTRTGDRARAWYAFAYSGAGGDETMKVFAICSASTDARVRVARFSVPPSTTKSKVVSCPRGQRALGGGLGIASSPISGVYEEGSGPLSKSKSVSGTKTGESPRAWEVAAYNGFGIARSFQALAICSKRTKPHIVASRVPVAPNDSVEVASSCPPGRRALGGGVLALGKPTPDLQFMENGPLSAAGTTAATVNGDVAVSWDGDVYNRTSKTRSFKTLAVCA